MMKGRRENNLWRYACVSGAPRLLVGSVSLVIASNAFSEDGTLDTPKSGHGRTVEISKRLAETLMRHERDRRQDKLRYGWAEVPPWLFVTKAGTPVDPANVRRAM
jgi:integrase